MGRLFDSDRSTDNDGVDPQDPSDNETAIFGPPPTAESVAEAEAWNAWSLDHAQELVRRGSVPLPEFLATHVLNDGEYRTLIEEQKLLVVPIDGVEYVPRWQFTRDGRVLPGLAEVIDNFYGDSLSLSEWLIQPSRDLGGQIPLILLERGEGNCVIEYVQAIRIW